MKKIYLTGLFSLYMLLCFSVSAQSIEQIKANRNLYLWGEGSGNTLKKADQEALAMLISQISTQVESSFSLLKDEISKNGTTDNFNETFQSVITTYSSATLKNAERIVISSEPDAKVFRYIKRDDVKKVFMDRENKLKGFASSAEKALNERQIADALRYFYWSLTLLKSHPDGSELTFMDEMGKVQLLATWLPTQINQIFSGLNVSVSDVKTENKNYQYLLDIRYKSEPVENFDYCFWSGSDWSNIISARSGVGMVELYGVAGDIEVLKLKAEYIFEGEARIDRELEDVMSKMDPVPFRNSYIDVLIKLAPRQTEKQPLKADITEAPLTEAGETMTYQKSMSTVLDAIKKGQYSTAQNAFTPEGYQIFEKLITYGSAKLLGTPELKYLPFENEIICRSVPMSFSFETNNKQFIENVVFHLDKEGKITNLTFGLSSNALNDIVQKTSWSERDRLILVNFLENYKTAYALKRLDYIENIFADNALIITGTLVKVNPNEDNRFQNNQIVKYNRMSKQEYIRNLKLSFASKDYININFEESKIRKSGKGGDIYGIQIKQNYFSSNYGDVGYLFLMVDLNNPDEPVIHVRTWQPVEGANDTIYGLSDFN